MTKRRMFSQQIIESDVFLDMPLSTQALYVHLCMNADDYGFVSPRRIMRMINASDDDLRLLISKRYILTFESGVVVIKHWHLNNSIRKDRSTETTYTLEYNQLTQNEFGAYTELYKIPEVVESIAAPITTEEQEITEVVDERLPNGQPDDNQMSTQIRLDKIRLDKELRSSPANKSQDVEEIFEFYVKSFDAQRSHIKLSDKRKLKIKARLRDAGREMIMAAITNTAGSQFHRGDNDRGWKADLDFIIRSYEQVEKLSQMTAVPAAGTNETRKVKEEDYDV